MVAAHVLCSDAKTSQFVASCAAFRIAGASQNGLLGITVETNINIRLPLSKYSFKLKYFTLK